MPCQNPLYPFFKTKSVNWFSLPFWDGIDQITSNSKVHRIPLPRAKDWLKYSCFCFHLSPKSNQMSFLVHANHHTGCWSHPSSPLEMDVQRHWGSKEMMSSSVWWEQKQYPEGLEETGKEHWRRKLGVNSLCPFGSILKSTKKCWWFKRGNAQIQCWVSGSNTGDEQRQVSQSQRGEGPTCSGKS